MGMIVQHNMSSMNANRNLGIVSGALSKSTEKLSSGYKINRAGDNAAGLAISEKMRGQIRGLDQASSNSEDGISLIQTAEGALTETHSILQRMRELAVQAASDTNTDDDRTQIQNEIDQLTSEVDRIATTTEFNSKKLLDGSRTGSVSQKDGKANVEGTFSNSNVSAAITQNGAAKESYTDIIRVEITEDFSAGKSTRDTQKYSDAELFGTAANKGAWGLISAKAVGTTTKEDAIAAALKDEQALLKTNQDTLSTTNDAIKTNQSALDDILKAIDVKNTAVVGDGANINKTGLFAEGVTIEDVKAAVQKVADAYTNAGIKAGTAVNADATAALAELDALFNTGATSTANDKIAATTEDTLGSTVAKNNTTLTVVKSTKDLDTVGAAAADYLAKLKTVAIAMSDVTIDRIGDQNTVDKQQKVVDLLSNTELAGAAYDYEKANQAKTATNVTVVKDEQQAIMDAAMDKIKELNADKKVLSVTDLFGNSSDSKKFEIASKVADDGSLTITLKNGTDGKDDTIITIANADKLKAGDVVTLTSEKMTESKQAATGEEALRLQVGANAGQEVALGINSMKAKDLSIVQTKEGSEGKALSVTSQSSASMAVNAYDLAIQKVSTERAKMGAVQNRLEHTISNLDTAAENLQTAESRIRDTDMAEEMTQYSKNNILMQAGQSMLAQANQSTQGVLSLLQ